MNVASYCLFGDLPKYVVGAYRNAETLAEWFPGWEAWFYLDEDSVDLKVGDKLESLGAKVIWKRCHEGLPDAEMFRFLAHDVPGVKKFIVRDVDCRFCKREVAAVQAWLDSGLPFHVMRDHPGHKNMAPAGMWGGTTGFIPSMRALMDTYTRNQFQPGNIILARPGFDELFVSAALWPLMRKHGVLVHDDFRDGQPHTVRFPSPIVDGHFVGEVYDSQDRPRLPDRESRNYENEKP